MKNSALKKLLEQCYILDIESDSKPFTHKFEREYELWRDDKDTHIKPSTLIAELPNFYNNEVKHEIEIQSNPKNDQTEFEKDIDQLKIKPSIVVSNNDSKDAIQQEIENIQLDE